MTRVLVHTMRFSLRIHGFFFQLVMPLKEGHISIAFESQADPVSYVEQVTHILHDHALLAGV